MLTHDFGDMLAEFHEALGDTVPLPGEIDWKLAHLRADLIDEESDEAQEAILLRHNRAHIAKELADLVYVAYGAAHFYKIPLTEVVAEVHRSNMTKFVGGIKRREDGKLLKGANYEEADVQGVLNEYDEWERTFRAGAPY